MTEIVSGAWWFSPLVAIVIAEPLFALLAMGIVFWNSSRQNVWALLLGAILFSMFVGSAGMHVMRLVDKRPEAVWTATYAAALFLTQIWRPISLATFSGYMIFRKKKKVSPADAVEANQVTPVATATATVTASTPDMPNPMEPRSL